MDFKTSQTMFNLARAFAGESQARTRYAIYAQTARRESMESVAQVFETVAQQELAHAEIFLNNLVGHYGQGAPNINIDAGYPFQIGTTAENLDFARRGESEENSGIYPSFAKTARDEGFEPIARLFDLVAQIEGKHAARFDNLFNQVNAGTLYTSSFPTPWVCSNCGHEYTGESPWQVCPVCGRERGYIEVR